MYDNASKFIEMGDGKRLQLRRLSADGMGALESFILDVFPKYSAQKELMTYIDKLPPETWPDLIKHAMALDHEEEMRERFVQVVPPKRAFFMPKVAAMWLHLLALPHNPAMTLDDCQTIVDKLTPVGVIGRIAVAWPDDIEKKESEKSPSPSDGDSLTGQPQSSNTEKQPTAA